MLRDEPSERRLLETGRAALRFDAGRLDEVLEIAGLDALVVSGTA